MKWNEEEIKIRIGLCETKERKRVDVIRLIVLANE